MVQALVISGIVLTYIERAKELGMGHLIISIILVRPTFNLLVAETLLPSYGVKLCLYYLLRDLKALNVLIKVFNLMNLVPVGVSFHFA